MSPTRPSTRPVTSRICWPEPAVHRAATAGYDPAMTTVPDEPTDADPAQLEEAGAAIDDAKAAASRVARDETIDTEGDLPSDQENVPAAPPTDDQPDHQPTDHQPTEGRTGRRPACRGRTG